MRFSAVAPLVLAAAPAVVSAAGTLGFALGTKRADGSCKSTADYETDLDAIAGASGSKVVRTYSASDCNSAKNLMPAAKAKGFQVVLGMWVPGAEDKDLAAIQAVHGRYASNLYAVTVGSEALYRDDLDGDALLAQIQTVKRALPDIKVGTADSWNKYADGTADPVVAGGVDILFVNAFGFWQAQPISNASAQFFDDIMQAFQHVQELTTSSGVDTPELWVGETGWPSTGGTNYGQALAGTGRAKQYFHQGVCGMLAWGVNTFFFEAFDEPWKPDSIGDNGAAADETHWGAMTADRQPKYSLRC